MIPQLTKKIFLFTVIVSFHLVYAQKIRTINIDSDNTLPEFSLSEIQNNFLGKTYSPQLMDSLLNKTNMVFISEGYFNSALINKQIEFSADSSESILFLQFNPGNPTIIKSINCSDTTKNEFRWISEYFQDYCSKTLSQNNINSLMLNILNKFETAGYSFAEIEINSINISEEQADIYLFVNKGKEAKIDKIIVTGNTSTEDYVVLRELPFTISDKFSEPLLEEARNNLIKLNYFNSVSLPEYKILNDGTGVVEIKVVEKNTNNFDGIVGYVPKTKTEDGYFTGFVNISMRNLLGTGRAAAIRWKQFNRDSQELEIKYNEPWLFSFPVSVGLELYQKKQDTTYVKRYLAADVSYLFSNRISAGFIFETESVIPTLKEPPVFTVYNSSIITTGLNLKIDTRDDFLSPKSGFLLNNNYKFSSKSINGPKEFLGNVKDKSINIQKFELDFEYYQTFANKHTIALKIGARELKSDLIEPSDNYYIGGNNTLRGYREKQFSGNRVLWSNLEYRYFIQNRSYLFMFFDTGYFKINEKLESGINGISEFVTGYGGGISLETSLGLMSISYALGRDDTFTQGKIHLGIINEF